MTKELRKAIILQSKLENFFNKDKTHFGWQKYKQRNICLNLLTKKQYFGKLNVKGCVGYIIASLFFKSKREHL